MSFGGPAIFFLSLSLDALLDAFYPIWSHVSGAQRILGCCSAAGLKKECEVASFVFSEVKWVVESF